MKKMNDSDEVNISGLTHTFFNFAFVVRGDLQQIERLKEFALLEGLTIRYERVSTEFLRVVQEERHD